jgi:DtxR family transcriptional regulator, Mn-dependent transcriptional regulator
MPSSAAENYLKAILVRSGDGDGVVATGVVAKAVGVTAGTATTMVKALATQGLLEHIPWQGVRLTSEGRTHALLVLRKHRLVETLLVRKLKMDWKDVHEEAEALEHTISDRLLGFIDEILNHPDEDPYGEVIPSPRQSLLDHRKGLTLATCEIKKSVRVKRIIDQSPSFLEFVQHSRLRPGARVRVQKRNKASGVVHCELRNNETTLGMPEASKIEVEVV